MEFDFLLTSEEKRKLLNIELDEDYFDIWGYRSIIAFVIPLIIFLMPLTTLAKSGYNENFICSFKIAFIIYGVTAYLLKAIEIAIRKNIYKKRKEEVMSRSYEDEQFRLQVKSNTIFLKGKENHKEIKMADIIDVLQIDDYLAICYGQYGEYIFIPVKDFKDGSLYNFLANINTNIK